DEIAALVKKDPDGARKLLANSRFKKNERASTRGIDVHSALEQIDLGVDPDVRGEAAPYVEQYRRFMDEHRPTPQLAEATVFDPDTTVLKDMPATRGAFVLVVSPYDYELVPVVTDEEVWQAFLHVKGVAEWALVGSKRVLSKAVPPLPTEELKAA